MGKYPFSNPNPNPKFSKKRQLQPLPLLDVDESPAFTRSAASDDASSISRRPNDFDAGRYVTFNISSRSKKEMVELKNRLVAELEQIRQLKSRIDSPADFQFRSGSNFLNKKTVGGPNSSRKILGNKRPFPGNTNPSIGVHDFNTSQYSDNSLLLKKCSQILSKLMKHKFGHIFNVPVDVVGMQLHDYYDIIRQPMDLGTVKKKLGKNLYGSPQDFAADVRLTFHNAMRYNPKGHDDVHGNERMDVAMETKRAKKGDGGDEEVDIGDEMPMSSFPPVQIEKDNGHGSSSGSGSSSSSDDSSSSSDSDSGSSSGSDSDDAHS
ncbi:Transcription factor GTE3, chloroplastic [Linum perenne]